MIDRLVRSADFERVLRSSPRAKTQHFAVHHLPDRPSRPATPTSTAQAKLSTAEVPVVGTSVDDSALLPLEPDTLWLGTVVPKRHARRSVTRNLLKRRIRAAMLAQGDRLDKGLWVVRLRAPFDPTVFHSAASAALARTASVELGAALRQAAMARGPR